MDIIKTTFSKLNNHITKNSVLSIGSFDGVHLAHQSIFDKMNSYSKDFTKIVITFQPHPYFVLSSHKHKKQFLLTDFKEKCKLIEKSNIDKLIILKFTKQTSKITAERFLKKLIKSFNPVYFLMGFNHTFGFQRKGDYNFVKNYANKTFNVISIKKKNINSIPISSSIIRNHIKSNDIELANKLLGREYSIKGNVVKGKGIGKTINFPTLNIKIKNDYKLIPSRGVYYVRVFIEKEFFFGMCNIGFRPTLTNDKEESIEVHIFSDNIISNYYNDTITISFLKYIRSEIKFKNLNFLRRQLKKDKEYCLSIDT